MLLKLNLVPQLLLERAPVGLHTRKKHQQKFGEMESSMKISTKMFKPSSDPMTWACLGTYWAPVLNFMRGVCIPKAQIKYK